MNNGNLNRRELLKLGSVIAAGLTFPGATAELFAKGLEKLSSTTRVVWLQAQSCSGDSISLLNTINPEPADLLTKFFSLLVHQNLGAAQGRDFMDCIKHAKSEGDYILAIEGSVPLRMPEACTVGGRTIESVLKEMIPKAKAVVAVGTCAAFGGVPSAEGNQTGAASVEQLMKKHQLPTRRKLVNCPSCPAHPKSMVGTLAYLAAKGYPDVDKALLTPNMFYSKSTHDECPRYHYYERKIFAKYLGDSEGCLFKLGCLGPLSYTNCPHRQWNSGVSWCVGASAPCIACSSPTFAKYKDFPFYRKDEQVTGVANSQDDQKESD